MYPVSNDFLAALKGPSHVVCVRVTTNTGVTLNVGGGNVSMDAKRTICRTADLELYPTSTLSASQVFDLVMTPDVELTIERGVILNGVETYVPLGVFSTDTAELSKAVAGTVTWQGSDRSKKVSRARFTEPYQVLGSTLLADAVTALLLSRYPAITVSFGNVTDSLQASVMFEASDNSDPWKAASDLMADYGYFLHFDGTGTCIATTLSDPGTVSPIFDFGSNQTQMILGGQMKGTFEGTYNGVIATGEGTDIDPPVRAEVWDTDPFSSTYYLGGYGKAPYFYSSPLLLNAAMATKAGQTILSQIKGYKRQLSWPAIVNPALEPFDVVSATFDGVTSSYVIDSLTIPLKASDSMNAVTREIRVQA